MYEQLNYEIKLFKEKQEEGLIEALKYFFNEKIKNSKIINELLQ
jgi:hypothetical protein